MTNKKLNIIYPYRDRSLSNLSNSLKSLENQSCSDFNVFLVDYGSKTKEVKYLCEKYAFVEYVYCPTISQPWNKSRALNFQIKKLQEEFCFVADIDILFHPNFITIAKKLVHPLRSVYFQVGFLKAADMNQQKSFGDYQIFRKSTSNATGMTLFPIKVLKELHGFDEFYHFWGAEDTDMHMRIKNAGYDIDFYDKEVLLLHQWHKSYRSKETNKLSTDLQISGIVQLNHEHLNHAIDQRRTKVNQNGWGNCLTVAQAKELEIASVNLTLQNEQRQINDLLYGQLPQIRNEILKIQVKQAPFQSSIKYRAKKLLGKKVPEYYNLKEINDQVLLHLISFYRDLPYSYKVSSDLKEIEIAINFKHVTKF